MKFELLTPKELRALRREFINKFADKSLPWYNSVMGYNDFYDSSGENGFLWEVLRPYRIITRSKATELIKPLGQVCVCWDKIAHRQFRRNGNKDLLRDMLLVTDGETLADYLENGTEGFKLPADIYVFPPDLSFYIAFTSDNLKEIGAFAITSLSNLTETGINQSLANMFEATMIGKRI